MKVAFDEHVPLAMVRVFQLLSAERKFKTFSGGLTVEHAKDFAPNPNDPDFDRGSDVPWIRRFASAGGKIIISGDTAMMKQDHERLALLQTDMIVIFFGSEWSNWKFHRKCALLLNWWMAIVATSQRAKPASFWRIPTTWERDGNLHEMPTFNKKLIKQELQKAAQSEIAERRRAKRQAASFADLPDLFDQSEGNPIKSKPKA